MKRSIKIIFSVIFIFSIIFGTNPVPPPYYQVQVEGHVKCDSIVNKSNLAIQLFGLSNTFFQDSLYHPILGIIDYNERPIDLTDSLGNFFIISNIPILFDSLKTGIVEFGKEVKFGEPFVIDETKLIKNFRHGTSDNGHGCTSCSETVTDTNNQIEYYVFYYPNSDIDYCPN